MALELENFGDTSPIVGIDLGTTNSLVAYVRDGKPEVLKSREGRALVPSVVSFASGEPVIGYAAKSKKIRDAAQTVFSVKRLLGRGFEDVKDSVGRLPYQIVQGEGLIQIRVGNKTYSAIEISAMILRELKLAAEQALGVPVHRAVITVPAYFNDGQRQATRAAGRLAGLEVLRIVNEPTAASLAYGLDRKREGLIAVYDLGGGTFDVSILKLHNGIFEVLATQGDTTLGGDDLDRAIAAVAASEIQARYGVSCFEDTQMRASLIESAENLKIAFSKSDAASFEMPVGAGRHYSRDWSVLEFETLMRSVVERTRKPCLNALKDAGLELSELTDVVLVGGPTRLKVVQQIAKEIFGREPNTSLHPDEVVAQGAAIQADILAGKNKDFLLLDVIPLSLGLETYGGLMSPLIVRNTRIPTTAREGFTTFVDNQTAVDIHVLQGERERALDNRSLARFKLKVNPAPAGMPRVEVTFMIDADGILQVAAKDLKSGVEQLVEVRPSFGLTDSQVEGMLQASLKHSEEDVVYRAWVEAKNEAEPVLRSTEKKLSDAYRLLTREEAAKIESSLENLRSAMKSSDVPRLREASFNLSQLTVRLADLLIQDALIGRSSDA